MTTTEPHAAPTEVDDPNESAESLRARCREMAERERKIMALLNCPAPEKIDHDLRNVMNELVLLRKVLEQEEG